MSNGKLLRELSDLPRHGLPVEQAEADEVADGWMVGGSTDQRRCPVGGCEIAGPASYFRARLAE
jgi:hypothetical protein